LGLAVLFSIVFHAALLLAFPGILERKKPVITPLPITARLVAPPPAVAPSAPPAAEAPTPPVEATKPPQAAKAAPDIAKKLAPQMKPAPTPPSPAAEPAQPAAAPAPAAPATALAPAPAVTARAEPQLVAPAAPSADEAGMIARFRLDIISQAKRFKRYPRMAMDNNWEGRTDVRIVFGADGKRISTTIVRSSGHETLDRQALDTLSKAFVPVPAALRGKEFAVEIPVIYSLKDDNA
jgi:protein TonB